MNKKRLLLIVAALGILAFIGGCAPTPTQDNVRVPVISAVKVEDISAQQRAQTILESAPLAANPDQRIFEAAMLFASAGDLKSSTEATKLVVTEQLTDAEYVEFNLFVAELELSLDNPQGAAERLAQDRFIASSKTFNAVMLRRMLSLQADIYFALGNTEQGLLASIDFAKLLKKQQDIRAVHNGLWRRLSVLPYSYLQQGQYHSNTVLAGWLQLAQLNREHQADAQSRTLAFADWQRRWRTHPAAKTPPRAIRALRSFSRSSAPAQVALLLPLQDNYEVPSYTLLDGFMGAYYEFLDNSASGDAPEIRLYDTSVQSLQKAYNNAVEDGAEMIIGPMRQSEVEALLPLESLPVPTLSLNRVDLNTGLQPDNLFQFGLSPQDEITQIADRAWLQGKRNVLLISPDNGWGRNSADFFDRYWTEKGGTLLDRVAYPSAIKDFTPVLKPPLLIDLSEDRALQIKRFVNSQVKSQARRRQDIDLVVVLGYPVVGRQIKPALDFLYASDVPVVATSHIYNGVEQAELDRDLSGVEFSAMPWTLPGQLTRELTPDKRLHTAYRHLYAVGHDAFLLHRNLRELQSEQEHNLFGATGLLSLSDGIIRRQQKWAKFQRGQVVELPR
ncbi:MAG: penicillin-binding protein activator [Porticoccaceae bacterium]